MRKLTKIALILIALGIVLLSVGLINNGVKGLSVNKEGINILNDQDLNTNTLDKFNNLNIDSKDTGIEIIKGDEFSISCPNNKSKKNISYEVINDTLNLKVRDNCSISFELFGSSLKSSKITISIPENTTLSNITLEEKDSKLNIDDISCTKLNLNSKDSHINIKGTLKGTNIINSKDSKVTIDSNLSEKDYSYDVECEDSHCKVNGNRIQNSIKKSDSELPNNFNINVKDSHFTLNFS